MEDLEKNLTKLRDDWRESDVREKEAGNQESERTNLDDSQGQWEQDGEEEHDDEEDSQKEANISQVREREWEKDDELETCGAGRNGLTLETSFPRNRQ